MPGSSPSGVGRHDTTPGQGWLRIKVMRVILVMAYHGDDDDGDDDGDDDDDDQDVGGAA